MMTDAAHEVRAVFTAALALTVVEERARYLDEACRDKTELRQRVEALLRAHAEAGDFLQGNGPDPPDDFPAEGPGTMIGRYKLLEEIGEGAFGRVFMAEQTEPVHRKVALKIIKAGMDTREVIARFEAERQALALMDHPNIAKILDAGVTGDPHPQPLSHPMGEGGRRPGEGTPSLGPRPSSPLPQFARPYFVMELVRGIPITTYCEEQELPTAERLRLFMKVCAAVQHAHQKGIIHRDLKPTNILVTLIDGEAVPKVIDFGVAKALGQKLTEKTLFTAFQQMIGTPAYMSPEQAALSGVDVDTRSDIYSLGVLLYELLTGVTPFDATTLHKAALDEIRRMIRETEPPKPSTRLQALVAADVRRLKSSDPQPSTLNPQPADGASSRRLLQIKETIRLLRGDLDWIVMKCLEKERARRYDTASALADDLQHHLDHQPVQASPPSTAYRARKFIRRHRFGVAMATTLTLALAAGLTAALIGFAQARQQRNHALAAEKRAERSLAIAEAINDFLTKDLLRQASPQEQPDRDVKLRSVLDRVAAKLESRFTNQPAVEASIREILEWTYESMGEYTNAQIQLDRAKLLFRRQYGPEDESSLRVLSAEIQLLRSRGQRAAALKLAEEVLPVMRRVLGTNHDTTLATLCLQADLCASQGKLAEAQKVGEEVVALERQKYGSGHPSTQASLYNLGAVYLSAGKAEESRKLFEEVRTIRKSQPNADPANNLGLLNNLAVAYYQLGQLTNADNCWTELVPLARRVLGPEHPHALNITANLANIRAALGKPDEARPLLEEVLAVQTRVVGCEHPSTLMNLASLASCLKELGQPADAQKLLEEVLAVQKRKQGDRHPETLFVMQDLASTLVEQGKYAEAQQLLEQVLERRREVLGPEHPDTLSTCQSLACAEARQGKPAEARKLFDETLSIQRRILGPEYPKTLGATVDFASAIVETSPAEASQLLEQIMPVLRRVLPPEDSTVHDAIRALSKAQARQGKLAEARQRCQELLDQERQSLGTTNHQTLKTMKVLDALK